MIQLTHAWGFTREPFAQDIPLKELYPLPGLKAFQDRFQYALQLRLVTVITGDAGSGKSTCLRAATSALHPSQYRVLPLLATSGTILELLRQMCLELGVPSSSSAARLFKNLRDLLMDTVQKNQLIVLLVDEAHLLRLEVFAHLHTLLQCEFDSRPLMPVVLSGQLGLIDRLLYHTSRPFSSRVVGKTHLEGLQLKDMEGYLNHHLSIAGATQKLLSDEAIMAIHQRSGGLLRTAGNLTRGALLAAAGQKCHLVSAEHVRLASSEIL
jgi:general secretion pathway protein A